MHSSCWSINGFIMYLILDFMASKVRLILQGVTRKCTNCYCCCCCLHLHHLYWIFLLFLALARKLISPSAPILFLLIDLPNKTPVQRDKLFQQRSNGTNIPSTQRKNLFCNEIIIHVSIQSIVLSLININKSIICTLSDWCLVACD